MCYANGTGSAYRFEQDDDLAGLDLAFTGQTASFNFVYDAAGRRTRLDLSDPQFLWRPPQSGQTDYSANPLNQ